MALYMIVVSLHSPSTRRAMCTSGATSMASDGRGCDFSRPDTPCLMFFFFAEGGVGDNVVDVFM